MVRMNQRGITGDMIELVLEYGEYVQDKVILNMRKLKSLIKKVSTEIKSKLMKLDKGGLVVVLADDCTVVTTYNCNKKRYKGIE